MALMFHAFSIPKSWYIFDGNTNSIFTVDKEQCERLAEIEGGTETEENLSVLKGFQDKGFCLEGKIEKILNFDGEVISAHLGSFVHEKVRTIMNPGQTTAEQCKNCWAITHCNLCAAYSDDLTGLSKDMRLSECRSTLSQIDLMLKTKRY